MSFTNRLPKNTNLLQPNKFKLVLPKLPSVEYYCQVVTIPAMDTPPISHHTPFNEIFVTGTNTYFSPLEVELNVDEDLKVWEEVYNWANGISFPRNFKEYHEQLEQGLYTDISILMMTNSNVPIIRFNFTHCFPISLGAMRLYSNQTGEQDVVTLPVTFRYDDYHMVRIKV